MYKKQILLLSFAVVTALLYTGVAHATESCGGTKTNIISCGSGDAIWSIFEIVINILAVGVGLAAVGGLVYGAILYTSARDDASQVSKAKTTIANVVVGLVLFVGMYSFLQYLIPGGIFDRNLSTVPARTASNGGGNSGGNNTGNQGSSNSKRFAAFKIASFNILGSKHTDDPSGNKYGKGWASAAVRLPKAMKALKDSGVSVAALQEVYPDQRQLLNNRFSSEWGIAAENTRGQGRAVVWDKSKWKKIRGTYIAVPAAGTKKQPFVLLEQITTKKRIWFMGIHNVAGHDATNLKKRETSLQRELAAIKAVKGDKHPIFIAGDFNDRKDGRSSAQCHLTPTMTNIFGKNGSGVCGKPAGDTAVDHIFYIDASAIRINNTGINKSVMRGAVGSRITDHPMVTANVAAK